MKRKRISTFTFNSTMALAKSTFSFSIKINKEIGVHKKKDKRMINKIRINNQMSEKIKKIK